MPVQPAPEHHWQLIDLQRHAGEFLSRDGRADPIHFDETRAPSADLEAEVRIGRLKRVFSPKNAHFYD